MYDGEGGGLSFFFCSAPYRVQFCGGGKTGVARVAFGLRICISCHSNLFIVVQIVFIAVQI